MIVYSLREYFILERYFLKEESMGLNDNSEKYKLDVNKNKKNQHHKHDKLFREILSNKKEIVKLINKYLGPKEKITEEMIERYDTKFITTSYEEKESDIVFKLKNNTEEIIETIKRMAEHIKDKEERKEFAKEVKYLLYGRLTKDEIEQIERILIEEEGEDAMLHAQMVIERDFKRAREEGRKEGMLHAQKVIERDFKKAREEGKKEGIEQKAINIAKKMLDEKIDINLITKITGLKKEQFME